MIKVYLWLYFTSETSEEICKSLIVLHISSYRVEHYCFYTLKDCLFVNIFVIEDEELQKFICVNLKSCFVRGLAGLSMTHIWRSEAESGENSAKVIC